MAGTPDTSNRQMQRRRWRLPVVLFLLTCGSLLLVGTTYWRPDAYLQLSLRAGNLQPMRVQLIDQWRSGLIYMAALVGILLTHEMGHFIAALIHRVPASLPFFLPLPITPIGTLGAVIAMDGRRADRKEIFDIGIAGPLAGMVVALPVMWFGCRQLDLSLPPGGGVILEVPWLIHWMLEATQPAYSGQDGIWLGQLQGNPLFMAGWVGFLITGLNMLPVSQLDGGHVSYCLLGPPSRIIARLLVLAAVVNMLARWEFVWGIMVFLILLIGMDHPPTRDDNAKLGWFRTVLGGASLAIPLVCFTPGVLRTVA